MGSGGSRTRLGGALAAPPHTAMTPLALACGLDAMDSRRALLQLMALLLRAKSAELKRLRAEPLRRAAIREARRRFALRAVLGGSAAAALAFAAAAAARLLCRQPELRPEARAAAPQAPLPALPAAGWHAVPGGDRILRIECPGVFREEVTVEAIGNGARVEIDSDGAYGSPPLHWRGTFEFGAKDGFFELEEDMTILEDGLLCLLFRAHVPAPDAAAAAVADDDAALWRPSMAAAWASGAPSDEEPQPHCPPPVRFDMALTDQDGDYDQPPVSAQPPVVRKTMPPPPEWFKCRSARGGGA